MAYYNVCPDCGGCLDPGEKCNCREEREKEKRIRAACRQEMQKKLRQEADEQFCMVL